MGDVDVTVRAGRWWRWGLTGIALVVLGAVGIWSLLYVRADDALGRARARLEHAQVPERLGELLPPIAAGTNAAAVHAAAFTVLAEPDRPYDPRDPGSGGHCADLALSYRGAPIFGMDAERQATLIQRLHEADVRQALHIIGDAASQPTCRWPRDYGPGLIGIELPEDLPLHDFGVLLAESLPVAMAHGERGLARDLARAGLVLGLHCQTDEPMHVVYMKGLWLEQTVWTQLHGSELILSLLAEPELQSLLLAADPRRNLRTCLAGHRLLFGRIVFGRFAEGADRRFFHAMTGGEPDYDEWAGIYTAGLAGPWRLADEARHETIFAGLFAGLERADVRPLVAGVAPEQLRLDLGLPAIMSDLCLPPVVGLVDGTFRNANRRRWHLVATAILHHQAQTGAWPDALAALPERFRELATDTWTGTPLVYTRTTQGFSLAPTDPAEAGIVWPPPARRE